ncbi:phosphotransferase [Actinomyces qiguomingii]|uniref:phosphotransferase n=1 Tax=Actinomyces qiguomingii TaxID=2057800 RepID=UPI000CA04524|nr:phosphotransferase [Actinomyces qiguomingii]
MSQPPTGPSDPNTPASGHSGASEQPEPAATSARERSPLALAALAAVAVPGLDPARLALPQEHSPALRVVGVVDTQGRHWEVLETHDDATGATLEAEAEVLRRIGRVVDDGRLSFNVPRPAGALRLEASHIQVRSHMEGRPMNVAALRPGPGLSAGLGKALGELHDLPTTVVSEAGLPVYDAEDVRNRWLSLLDDAAGTGKVPPALLARWEVALENSTLWRFRPVVVHGDLAPENVLTAGGAVVAVRGLGQAHVGDPAEDMAWVYASVPVDCLDAVESAYDLARVEGVDRHLRDRAELVSELSLARWLMHGVRSHSDSIVDDAVSMLTDLADQVGDEPLVEPTGPRLAPVPGDKEPAEPEATTSEVKMVLVDEPAEDAGEGAGGSNAHADEAEGSGAH